MKTYGREFLRIPFSCFFAIFFLLCLSYHDKERMTEFQTKSEKESLERNFYLSKLLVVAEKEKIFFPFSVLFFCRRRRRREAREVGVVLLNL
jgi:hypothetical protein